MGTSLPGVFAAGDIRHGSSSASPGDLPIPQSVVPCSAAGIDPYGIGRLLQPRVGDLLDPDVPGAVHQRCSQKVRFVRLIDRHGRASLGGPTVRAASGGKGATA
jgi:hypothetical protein